MGHPSGTPTRRRWVRGAKLALYVVFLLSYLLATWSMSAHFHNEWAAMGYLLTSAFILTFIILWCLPDERLHAALPPGSMKRGVVQSSFMLSAAILLVLAAYMLYDGIRLRQRWTGDSRFCAFTAYIIALKWPLFCARHIHHSRPPRDIDDPAYYEKLDAEEILPMLNGNQGHETEKGVCSP